MKILILGHDGYIGFPLTLHFLKRGHSVFGIDNFSRRARVKKVGSDSLTPIESKINRRALLKQFPNWLGDATVWLGEDNPNYLLQTLENIEPDTIIHLAEQPSAPYSMKDAYTASATQLENVVGTLHLLWAMATACPKAHLIKLGTMGEYGCYDDKTEILTSSGWKLFNQLTGTEKVATRTSDDRNVVFKIPNSIHEYDFDGDLYCLQNNRLDMMVTPNHRMFTVKRSGSDYYGLREEIAENIINKSRVYDIGLKWEGEDIDTFDILGNTIPAGIWLKFLGWFLSEGSVEVRKDRPNPYRIVIKQKNTQSYETRKCMQDMADVLAVPFHEYKEGNIDVFILSGKDLANYMLNRFGRSKDKFIPQDIKQLNQKHLNTLLGYLLAGDGWKHHRGFRYATISKRLADDIQEIALKCGWAATISHKIIPSESTMYTVNISKSIYSHVNNSKDNFNDSWVPYKGKVYCVNVGGDGIIFVRRNGKPYWSGNTPSCDIPEGVIPNFCPNPKMEGVYCPMKGLLFPRRPGSFYHVSKVMDTINIEFACRNWGLSSTDIMQGVLFGINSWDEPSLITRFDYDEHFGTVINRFVAQALAGIPLTVYGKGNQTRGYLPLKDSIQCLSIAAENPPSEGEYRTFNQFEQLFSVNELADMVCRGAREHCGICASIQHIENPRLEAEDHYYNPAHQHLFDLGYVPSDDFASAVIDLIKHLEPFKDRIITTSIMPETNWRRDRLNN